MRALPAVSAPAFVFVLLFSFDYFVFARTLCVSVCVCAQFFFLFSFTVYLKLCGARLNELEIIRFLIINCNICEFANFVVHFLCIFRHKKYTKRTETGSKRKTENR